MVKIKNITNSSVNLLRYFGNDRTLAERCWVSTQKADNRTDEDVCKVIDFIVNKRHTSPLESVMFSFRIQTAIAVDREFMTHRMTSGRVALSHRYCHATPEFILPVDLPDDLVEDYQNSLTRSYQSYEKLIVLLEANKVSSRRAREQSRYLLPIGLMCIREFDINLLSLCNFLNLRTSKDALLEMQQLAALMEEVVMNGCPDLKYVLAACKAKNWRLG